MNYDELQAGEVHQLVMGTTATFYPCTLLSMYCPSFFGYTLPMFRKKFISQRPCASFNGLVLLSCPLRCSFTTYDLATAGSRDHLSDQREREHRIDCPAHVLATASVPYMVTGCSCVDL